MPCPASRSNRPSTLEVVPGTPVATSDPVAEAAITIGDGALTGVPARVSPGRHLWQVTAVGDLPHRFQLYGFPEPITRDQLLAALEALGLPEGATPPAGLPDLGRAVQLGGLGVQSAGLAGWPVLDLTAGTYIAMCPIQDGEAGVLHGLLGEVAVFTVD